MKTHRLGTVGRPHATLLAGACALLIVLTPPTARAEDNTLTVIGGTTISNTSPFILGNSGTNNLLIVTNGGRLINSTGTIGFTNTASANLAVITGVGSLWSNTSTLTVGYYGSSNTLVVADGAQVSSTTGYIGRSAVSNTGGYEYSSGNTVQVTGAGSRWRMAGAGLNIGFGGGSNNWLVISNGASVTNRNTFIRGTSNGVAVEGAGSLWEMGGILTLGGDGGTAVWVRNGAALTASNVYLGASNLSALAPTNGARFEARGPDTRVVVSGVFNVGRAGNAHETLIADGASLTTGSMVVGQGSSANPSVLSQSNRLWVTGAGTTWSNRGLLTVGARGGTNELVVSNGARAFTAAVEIGSQLSSSFPRGADGNSIVITGDGTRWVIGSNVTVGAASEGNRLLISDGARVTNTFTVIGGSNVALYNRATLAGPGTQWDIAGPILVGQTGSSNSLEVIDGARLVTPEGFIGWTNFAAGNTAIISGPDSLWEAGSRLILGLRGAVDNQLMVLNGGRLTNGFSHLYGNGVSAAVDGLGSRWDTAGRLYLNSLTNALVTVANGGRLTAAELLLGASNQFSRPVALGLQAQGNGTTVVIAGDMVIGRGGAFHQVTVLDGASLTTANTDIGVGTYNNSTSAAQLGDSNSVVVAGAGAAWTNLGRLRLGVEGGTNFLIISNGAHAYTTSAQIGALSPNLSPPPPGFAGSAGNVVVVAGNGSFWDGGSNLVIGLDGRGNRLEVRDGASVTNAGADIGGDGGSSANRAVVSGLGSTWDVSGEFWAGRNAGSQRLTVSNGATVRTENAFIGNATFVSGLLREIGGNQVLVGGSNATWINSGTIILGSTNNFSGTVSSGGTNRLDIGPDGRVFTSRLLMNSKGSTTANSRQRIVINGGELHVTNDTGTGLLSLGTRSQLELLAGNVRADDFRSLFAGNLLVVSNTLHVGGYPALSNGDMAVGRFESIGSAILGGLIIGGEEGSTGEARFGRTPTVVPATNRAVNPAGNAPAVVGGQGQGLLAISNVALVVNELSVGRSVGGAGRIVVDGSNASLRATAGIFVGSNGVTAGAGSIVLTNGATLSMETLLVGSNGTGGVTNYGGRFQFATNTPLIAGPDIVGYDATIDFTNVANAFLQRDELPGVTNIQFFGALTYELSRSTNATPEFLELRTNSAAHYQRVSLRGNSLLQTTGLLVGPGTALVSPTNGNGSVSGLVTNFGRFTGHASTLTFLDGVEFGPGATVDGTNVTFGFRESLLVRSNTLVVPGGVTFEIQNVGLDGGALVSGGALQFTNLLPVIPASGVLSSNGILSFRDLTNAPLDRTGDLANIAVAGTLDFRLRNATNAYVSNYIFQAANTPTGYSGLRLDGGVTRWQSGGLTIGPGGLLWVSNTTPTIAIDDATLRIEDGRVIHAVNGSYTVGYADVPGAATIATGSNALWRQAGTLYVGWTNGAQSLLVSNGATATLLGALIAGGGSNSHGNRLIVSGPGASLSAPSISVGVSNSFNDLLIRDGGSVTQSSTSTFIVGDDGGVSNSVRVLGGGRLHTMSTVATIGQNGLFSGPEAVANHVLISGVGSVWEHAGELRVGWGTSNSVTVEDGGRLYTGSAYVEYSGSNNLAVVRGVNSLWSNQTFLYVGRNGLGSQLRVEVGGRVISSNLTVSQSVGSSNNSLIVNGGYLSLTNASGTGSLDIAPFFSPTSSSPFSEGRLEISRGEIMADRIRATNGWGRILFSGGLLSVGETIYRNTNGFNFVVGDATNGARLHLRGGTHTFNTGLTLNEHAALTGSGTVAASVTNRGDIAPGDSAGALTLQSNLSLAASARMSFEIGGLLAGTQHDFVAVSNLVEFAGTLSLALLNGFTPAPGDAFTLMTYGSRSGAFANADDGARVNTANNLGSFHVSYSGNALTVSAYQSTDADGDGIEDAWAVTYFGASPLANGTGPMERFGDLDGDGQNNHAEFVAGTNPTDALDVFGVTELLPRADGTVRVRFRHLPGKTQRLFVSTDLVNWTEVPNPWLSFPAASTAEWLDDGVQVGVAPAAAGMTQRYYRVTVE
jgi:T5SS/PEP-CTERM-associated repeat protein